MQVMPCSQTSTSSRRRSSSSSQTCSSLCADAGGYWSSDISGCQLGECVEDRYNAGSLLGSCFETQVLESYTAVVDSSDAVTGGMS